MNKPQLDARMEYAERILRGLPKTGPTIAIDSILGGYETEDLEEVLESIQAYADIRARQAIFVIYEAARATAPSDAQPVGVISVTEEHGWHMEPLVGWEQLGYGRRLFAEQTYDVLIPGNPYIAAIAPREEA